MFNYRGATVELGQNNTDVAIPLLISSKGSWRCGTQRLSRTLIRLFTARIKLGMFDPPGTVPYTKIDEKEFDSSEHRAEACRLASSRQTTIFDLKSYQEGRADI